MKKRVLRKPSPNDEVVHLFPARALDNEPDGDVIARYRPITNGSNRVGMAMKITQLT